MKKDFARLAAVAAIAVAGVALAGCAAVQYPDTSKSTPPAKQSVINSNGIANVPDVTVFWQDIGDGYKVLCMWGEGSQYESGFTCDWGRRVPN